MAAAEPGRKPRIRLPRWPGGRAAPAARSSALLVAVLAAALALVAAAAGASTAAWIAGPLCGRPGRGGSRVARVRSSRACGGEESGLYGVLGVSKDASVSDIKKAYYREARAAHPDTSGEDDESRRRFQEVAEAYQTLADPARRQQYDLRGLAGLAQLSVNATRLFGPPPWRVLLGRTDHWMWGAEHREYLVKLIASSIPNGIAGVTMRTVVDAYDEAYETRVAVLLDRVSEEQAKDTVEQIEAYGLAVKAEAIEGERSNERETPLQYFRRIQRELGEASESLRTAAIGLEPEAEGAAEPDAELDRWIQVVRGLRSELRAAALGLEEFKLQQTG